MYQVMGRKMQRFHSVVLLNHFLISTLTIIGLIKGFEVAESIKIRLPPNFQSNQASINKHEAEKVIFPCDSMSENVTVTWYRKGISVRQIVSLEPRIEIPADGSLIINPLHMNDSGFYECTNGIGDATAAVFHLTVEFPATVTYSPDRQYLPNNMSGMVQCYIHAVPKIWYVIWTKDQHVLDPDKMEGYSIMPNGSLVIERVNESDQGLYSCIPYNVHGTKGASKIMLVMVLDPPKFVITPHLIYHFKQGTILKIPCTANVSDGLSTPLITWRKADGGPLPIDRARVINGTLYFQDLQQVDNGEYACLASNEVATVVTHTRISTGFDAAQNTTKCEAEKVVFPCDWHPRSENVTIMWYRDGISVRQIESLEPRIETPADGSLIVNPLHRNDSGFYECWVTNGIGDTKTVGAYLTVEFPATVTYSTHVQYLPNNMTGVVQCYIQAKPEIQFVMWTKDKHLLEPYELEGHSVLPNGSLVIERVSESHQGIYTCTPYNVHGTKGASKGMRVIVKDPPKFAITPDPIYQYQQGIILEIPCTAYGSVGTSTPLITWQKGNGQPIRTDRAQVNNGTLYFQDLQQIDIGDYECWASNEIATVVTYTRVLTGNIKLLQNTTKHEAEKLVFPCDLAPSSENVTVKWYRDGIPVRKIKSLESRIETPADGSLIINPLHMIDSGFYECWVTSGIGDTEATGTYLDVKPAEIIELLQNITKHEAEKVVVFCNWDPISETVPKWYRDGIRVRKIELLEPRIETPADGSLIINPLHGNDSGFYECRVTNEIGDTKTASSAYLTVEFPATVTYSPVIQYLPNNMSAVVQCYIHANPEIQFVMWTKDKHLLEPYEREGHSVLPNGSLVIERVSESHQGIYTCTPYNIHGTKGSSKDMRVIVKDPPKFAITPDPIYQYQQGTILEIPCTANGSVGTSIPLITWQKEDGRPLPIDRARVINGTLYFQDLQHVDNGEYACLASNEVATVVTRTRLSTGAPYNLSIVNKPDTFGIDIQWMPPILADPASVAYYQIQYRLGADNWKPLNEEKIMPPLTSYSCDDLIEKEEYTFRVVAFTLNGNSVSSEEVVHELINGDNQGAVISFIAGGILLLLVAIIIVSFFAFKMNARRK